MFDCSLPCWPARRSIICCSDGRRHRSSGGVLRLDLRSSDESDRLELGSFRRALDQSALAVRRRTVCCADGRSATVLLGFRHTPAVYLVSNRHLRLMRRERLDSEVARPARSRRRMGDLIPARQPASHSRRTSSTYPYVVAVRALVVAVRRSARRVGASWFRIDRKS